jgi:putative RecB family exonuclease
MPRSQALEELKNELHISSSQIFVYLNCSLKYQFMYVEARKPELIPIALPFGSAIHSAMEMYYRSVKNSGNPESLEAIIGRFEDCLSLDLDHSDIPVIYKKAAPDKDSVIKMGKGLLEMFYESVDLTGMQVIGAELPLSATLYTEEGSATELKLIGVLDLLLRDQNGELLIVDHKTAAQKKAQSTVNEDLAFTVYSYLLAANRYVLPGADVNCRMDVLRKLKTPKMEQYYTVRTRADRKRFAKIASIVLAGIESRIFMPQPSWMCSDCSHKRACQAW